MAFVFDDIQSDVAVIFLSYFQRAPEFEAMQHYVGVYESLLANPETAGSAFTALSAQIYADGTANNEVPSGPTITDAWYVNYLYTNILGRAPDAEGAEYWTTQLETGEIARADLVGIFVGSALGSEGRDAEYLANRTEVAVAFAQWENSNPNILNSLEYNAAEVLLGVNEDPATVTAAEGRLESVTGVIGARWNLTDGIDTLLGTTSNDIFNAVFENGNSTLTAFDSIDGNLGTDTLNIYVESGVNSSFPANATVKNIEIVNVFNGRAATREGSLDSGADYLLNVSNYEGVEQFWQIDSARSVTEVSDDVTVGFRNIANLRRVDVDLDAASSVANIVLDNVGQSRAALDVNGATTVNVAGALHADADGLDLDVRVAKNAASLTVNSAVETDVDLELAEGATTKVNTLDFSGSTGDISFFLDSDNSAAVVGANAALTVSFGAGDDVIGFMTSWDNGRGLTLRDSIDGGEGYDTIVLNLEGKLQTQAYDSLARVQNFEQVALIADSVSVDVAELGGLDLLLGTEQAVVQNATDGQVIRVVSVSDDFSSVSLENSGANLTFELGYEDNQDAFVFFLDAGTAAAKTLGATGGTLSLVGASDEQDCDFVVSYDNSEGKFADIDATDLTGALSITGLSAAVAESITLGEATEAFIIFTVGAEARTVEEAVEEEVEEETVVVPVPAVASTSSVAKTDKIVGFTQDEDGMDSVLFLDFCAWETKPAQNEVAREDYSTKAATLNEALALAAAAKVKVDNVEQDADVVVFLFGGDTYVFADTISPSTNQYDAGDFLVQLVGFTDYSGLELSGF